MPKFKKKEVKPEPKILAAPDTEPQTEPEPTISDETTVEQIMADPEPEPSVLAEPSKAEKLPCKWMTLTYDGTAMDTHTTPEVLQKGEDGKPMKRRVVVPAVLNKKPLEVRIGTYHGPGYELWGWKFKPDEPVTITADHSQFTKGGIRFGGLALKAKGLGCFKVECDKELIEKELAYKKERRSRRRV